MYCLLKCFILCLLFLIVGPGAMPLTLMFGDRLIALVLVNVYKLVLLIVYEKKKWSEFEYSLINYINNIVIFSFNIF